MDLSCYGSGSSDDNSCEGEPHPKKMKPNDDDDDDEDAEEGCPMSPKARASGGTEALMSNSDDIGSLHLLDEVQDDDASDQQCSDGTDSYDSEIPEEEIDALLEEGLPDEMKGPRKPRPKASESNDQQDIPYEMKEKVVLIEKCSNPFEILPEGWVEASHYSGMPVYLHRETRVCTFSRPYFLGSGSVRKHDVPLGSIPCFQYLKAVEKEKSEKEKPPSQEENGSPLNEAANAGKEESQQEAQSAAQLNGTIEDRKSEPAQSSSGSEVPACPFANGSGAPLESQTGPATQGEQPDGGLQLPHHTGGQVGIESHTCQSLEPGELLDYCKRRFEFKTIKLLKFRSWAEKRQYQKSLRKRNRPVFPEGTSLFSLKRPEDKNSNSGKRDWVINPKGKSYLCILHEYLQQVLKIQPKYEFSEIENALTPYSATLTIGDIRYCTGYGSSKKQAKMEAAKNTLEVLLPDFGKKFKKERVNQETDLSYFDEIRIEDPRVPDLCNKTSELSPFSILLNCLQRNFGLSGNHIQSNLITRKNQKNEFIMTVGKHTVEVQCKNKKDGKHRASQAILQKLHPHINNWGSLLRLYGNRSLQTLRERKPEMQEITLLQTSATLHQPNTAIIKKLKEEMLKLSQMKAQIQPIGKFLPPGNISFPTKHGSELNNVDL